MFMCSTCSAARVCLIKTTGKLIEYQSHATKGTLIQNALNAGWELKDIEEREITKKEWEAIKKKWITDIAEAEQALKDAEKEIKKEELKKKFGWTDGDIEKLREVLK